LQSSIGTVVPAVQPAQNGIAPSLIAGLFTNLPSLIVSNGPGADAPQAYVQVLPAQEVIVEVQPQVEVEGSAVVLASQEEIASVKQLSRYLRVANSSKNAVTVSVLYETATSEGMQWYPAQGDQEEWKPLEVSLEPGEVVDLKDGNWKLNASRVRIWATGESRAWERFKQEDLWLVPEVDDAGNHSYRAPEPDVFVYSIR